MIGDRKQVYENISTEIVSKICSVLNCDVGDIMEFVPDKKEEQ